jgi:hypothetical protein
MVVSEICPVTYKMNSREKERKENLEKIWVRFCVCAGLEGVKFNEEKPAPK